jgi:hypothetical protein
MKITQAELKRQLHYDPDLGIFIWRVSKHNQIPIGSIAGNKNTTNYIAIKINGVLYKAHRLAFLYMEGYFPEHEVDHIDRNVTNNAWKNLREVSRVCNCRNCGIAKNNTSGITGVRWHKNSNRWQANISVNSKLVHLGIHKNKLDAAKARWEAEVKYGYPTCNTTSSAYLYLKEHGALD